MVEFLQDNRELMLLLLIILFISLVAIALAASWHLRRSITKQAKLSTDVRSYGDMEKRLADISHKLQGVSEELNRLTIIHSGLEAIAKRSIQKVGMIRFNAFGDIGGEQSFSIALLDSYRNGVVLSHIRSCADSRIYAKPIQSGNSEYALSDEEKKAIYVAISKDDQG